MDGQNISPEMAQEQLLQIVQETGVSPEKFSNIGNLAEQVMKDKNLYPKFVNEMINMGIGTPEEFGNQVNYQALIAMSALGRAAKALGAPVKRVSI